MNKNSLLNIFITFFKIGLFTFGGGYAMIRVMQKEVVEKKGWIDADTMLDMVTVSESTPGPFAINSATFIGYHQRKFLGSLFATLGVVLPSFIIIILISIFLNAFSNNELIQNVLKGINAGVPVLIFHAWFKLGKQLKINLFNIGLMLLGFGVAFFTDFSIILLLLIMAVLALIFTFMIRGKKDAIHS